MGKKPRRDVSPKRKYGWQIHEKMLYITREIRKKQIETTRRWHHTHTGMAKKTQKRNSDHTKCW